MLGWFDRHSQAITAISAVVTAVLALAAIIGVKVQIDGAARIQREQSARDIYREYLNLSVQKPEFAAPDHCALEKSPQFAAYRAYVDYLLFTGEQVLSVDPDWAGTIHAALEPHAALLCSIDPAEAYADADVEALISDIRVSQCERIRPCP